LTKKLAYFLTSETRSKALTTKSAYAIKEPVSNPNREEVYKIRVFHNPINSHKSKVLEFEIKGLDCNKE